MTENGAVELIADFRKRVKQIEVSLDAAQIEAIEQFCHMIARYQEHTNLVGSADLAVLLNDHVLDSLTLLPIISAYNATQGSLRVVDLGTGAGFPAIVLAIAQPLLKVTMIEAVGKKCKFLEDATTRLGLSSRCLILNARAEKVAHEREHRAAYDIGCARAVGSFDLTAELVLPFLTAGGLFIAQKSAAQLTQEQERARYCLPKLGASLQAVIACDESVLGKAKVLMVARKTEPTAPLYPRAWNQIKAHPLGDSD